MPKIAILIPSYKPGEYIERCLDSIESQTLAKQHFTVYIALNGPKEHYEEYLLEMLSRKTFHYKYYYLSESGVSNARNLLIDNSTEPYITFMDDDDCISEIYLESLLSVVSKDGIAISNVYEFEKETHEYKPNYIGQSFLKLHDVETSKFKSRKYFSSPWAKLMHRDIISTSRFDTTLSLGEDSLFMAQISKNVHSVRKANFDACYFVYERVGSASRKNIDRMAEVSRIYYLLSIYSKMLFSHGYNKVFILSRIMATVLHGKKLFRLKNK